MINIIKYGWNYIHTESDFYINRTNTIDTYLLLIIRSPSKISINNEPVKSYPKNCIMLILPHTPHYYSCAEGEPFVNDWLYFTTDIPINLKVNTVFEGLDEHNINILSMTINEIVIELRENMLHSNLIAGNKLNYLLLKSEQIVKESSSNMKDHPHYSEMLWARNQLLNNFHNDISVNDYAKQIHMSPSFFRHLYKELFGTSPQSDIINTRIQYAQHLLKTTKDPIKVIAEECGYKNCEHFMRQFKLKNGITPSEYR